MEETYSTYGFRSAKRSESNPEGVEGYLDNVYEHFLEDQKLDEQGLKDRITKLKAEAQQETKKKNDLGAEISSLKREKEDKEKEIEETEIEKVDIRNGEGEMGDTSSFIIGAFITILLTLYLFIFYSSSGYSAFYGVKAGNLGFLNGDALSDAYNKGGGVITLIVLFPIIFLGLGFLIHNSLEENKKLILQDKKQKFSIILSLLFITFVADAIIGYKISQGVHTNQFNSGLSNEVWQFNMIYTDINFYLVLILGFVVYVIWGFLLNYVLSHSYLKTESEKVKILLENINNKITDKRNELAEIIAKIHRAESDILTCESNLKEKEKDIIGYENGVIPINVASLKGSVGEFMGGWQNYSNGNFNAQEALKLNNEAIKVQNIWLENKLQNLDN